MSINNGYCTLEELQDHINSDGTAAFTGQDITNLETAIEAISRVIDLLHQTHYYGATETRLFTAWWGDSLGVDDLISVTTLKTDADADGTYEDTWTTSDYVLEPVNARLKANDTDKRPYREIRTKPGGDYTFPRGVRNGVQVAGVWGYTTEAPLPIKQAVLLAAHRIWKRKDSIFGIEGTPELGVHVMQARIMQDSDIMLLLEGVETRSNLPRLI